MSDDKIVKIDQAQGIRLKQEAAKLVKLVNKCQVCFFDHLPKLIRELFEHADDDMYDLANKAKKDIVETQYFCAMRELRKLREDIERSFTAHLKNKFKEFWISHDVISGHEAEIQLENLALIEVDELEEQLAVDGLVSKAVNRYSVELQGLSARFAVLARIDELDSVQNPLAPYHFVDAFRIALRQWEGDIGLRLVVFKIFDQQVINYIGGIYDSINDILIEEGVLPKLQRRIKKNPVAPTILKALSGTSSSTAAIDSTTDEFTASSRATFDAMGCMITWLAQSRGYAPYNHFLPAVDNAAHLPVASDVDVLDALTLLQQSILNSPLVMAEEIRNKNIEYLAYLAKLLRLGEEHSAQKRLGEHDSLIIDTVGMLFDFIIEGRALPDSVKALVSRLQFPLIKAAKIDFSFFGNKDHPARRLLNTIARATAGWTDDGNRSKHSVYGQVEAAIEFVLEEFVDDLKAFDTANERLDKFLAQQTERAARSEERVAKFERGQEDLLRARRRVAEVIHDLNLRSESLPEVVIDFEREAWHDVLMLALLRDGEDSQRWREHLATLKLLIWSVMPKAGAEDRQKLLKIIPPLLKKLRAGLANIGFEMSKASRLFARLQLCHRAILAGKHDVLDSIPARDDGLKAGDDDLRSPLAESKNHANIPEVGAWLKWTVDGVSFRGKLAWHSTLNGKCIFVNQNGMKLAEMGEQQLADLLDRRDAEVLSGLERPFVDSVLESMHSVVNGGKRLSKTI